jgi:transmembrane sensor
MNQYKEYSLEDFVLDARFQNWVRYKRSPDNLIWQKYQLENAHQSHDIRHARVLLESVYQHYQADIQESEIDFEIQELLSKVRAEKEVSLNGVTNVRRARWKRQFFGHISTYQAAAIIALALGLAFLVNHYNFRKTTYESLVSGKQLEEIRNETDQDKIVLLADGSKVTLQPNSMLSFPETFLADKREVYLSGEAFFQVSKDSNRPFFVYANELVTKVLGTSFMVNAADAAHKTTVEVKEGKVSVFKQDDFRRAALKKTLPLKGLVLTANQKVVFETENSDMLKTLSDKPEIVLQEASPKTFDFVNTPASSVLADLKSAYQIDIIFDKELLAECPVTASLNRQSLFEKLNIICEVIEARYEIIDGQIVVYSRGCKS